MTVQKAAAPLVLLMFTVLCALPAAAVGVIPSAIAQEDDDQDLSAGDTNTQIGLPLMDQDQGAANLGANLAANLDIEHILEEAPPTPPEEEPPEFVAWCLLWSGLPTIPLCFNTSEECEAAQGFIIEVAQDTEILDDCDPVEELPPNALECVNLLDQVGDIVTVRCEPPDDTTDT